MRDIKTFGELQNMISENEVLLVILTSPDCCVCHADMPRVEKLAEEFGFLAVHIDVSEVPEAAGQLTVFTVPAVLLFYEEKEYHREARIIDFSMLRRRMTEISERL